MYISVMASSELLTISQRRPNFNDSLSAKKISDVQRTTHDLFKTKDRYFKEQVVLTAGSQTLGTEVSFTVQRSDAFVGGFYLEVLDTNAGTLDVGKLWLGGLINYVQVEISGQPVYRYSGLSLIQYLCTVNTQKDIKDYMGALMGGDGGDVGGNYYYIPLLTPGNNGIFQSYGSLGTNPVYPIGKSSTDMVIKIGLRSQAAIDVNSTIVLSHLKLHYYRYRLKSSLGIAETSAGKQVVYSFHTVYIQDQDFIRAQTSGAVDQIDLSNIVTNGDLQWVGFNQVIDGNYVTACEHFETQAITQAYARIKGSTEIYRHDTLNQSIMIHMANFRDKNIFPNTATHFFNIPLQANFAWRSDTLGASGCNLNLEQLNLYILAPATDTVRLHTMGVYKAVIQLFSDQTSDDKLIL